MRDQLKEGLRMRKLPGHVYAPSELQRLQDTAQDMALAQLSLCQDMAVIIAADMQAW